MIINFIAFQANTFLYWYRIIHILLNNPFGCDTWENMGKQVSTYQLFSC